MKITKRQLRRVIREEKKDIAESYNSMSPRSRSLANAAKRRFAKDYPEVQVGIDGREGWITVNGNKAVNMSQASGSPLSMGDIIDQMKQAYLGHNMEDKYAVLPADDDPVELARHKAYRDSVRLPEGKMKITKRQLRRIIKEEKARLIKEYGRHDPDSGYDQLRQDRDDEELLPDMYEPSREEAERYLKDRADSYRKQNLAGKEISMLLHDDFMDDLGNVHHIEDFKKVIDELVLGESKKITKRQLRRITKEEKAKLKEYGGRPYDPTVSGDYERYRDNPTGDAPMGGISQALIDDYNSWVHKEGHVTPAASSVMASYLITNRMEEDHDAHQMMADFFGLTHEDVMRDIKRQQSEQVASMGEGTSLGNMPDSWRQILGDCLGD